MLKAVLTGDIVVFSFGFYIQFSLPVMISSKDGIPYIKKDEKDKFSKTD